jgi:hypothetical protein
MGSGVRGIGKENKFFWVYVMVAGKIQSYRDLEVWQQGKALAENLEAERARAEAEQARAEAERVRAEQAEQGNARLLKQL